MHCVVMPCRIIIIGNVLLSHKIFDIFAEGVPDVPYIV